MKTINKTVLAVGFILLIEFLYLHDDPLSFGLPFRSVVYCPKSLRAGWNISLPVEIRVDDESIYHARIRKNIFVPWIQVEIHKMIPSTQTNENREN
jgi:hypothetical protein